MRLWRISNYAGLHGLGGLRAGGRWHSPGQPIVYCAEHPAVAMLEVLISLEFDRPEDLPENYQLLEIEVPTGLTGPTIKPDTLATDWRENEAMTRQIGDAWLKSRRSALLIVPSSIMPQVYNYLLNTWHEDASRLKVIAAARYPFDVRLFSSPPA